MRNTGTLTIVSHNHLQMEVIWSWWSIWSWTSRSSRSYPPLIGDDWYAVRAHMSEDGGYWATSTTKIDCIIDTKAFYVIYTIPSMLPIRALTIVADSISHFSSLPSCWLSRVNYSWCEIVKRDMNIWCEWCEIRCRPNSRFVCPFNYRCCEVVKRDMNKWCDWCEIRCRPDSRFACPFLSIIKGKVSVVWNTVSSLVVVVVVVVVVRKPGCRQK